MPLGEHRQPGRLHRVLLIDDDAADRQLCELILSSGERGLEVEPVTSAMEFAAAFAGRAFDAVILALEPAWTTAAAVVDMLRQTQPDLPVILLTSPLYFGSPLPKETSCTPSTPTLKSLSIGTAP